MYLLVPAVYLLQDPKPQTAFLLHLQAIEGVLAEASEGDKQCWADQLSDKGSFPLTVNNAQVELTTSMIEFKSEQKKETGR